MSADESINITPFILTALNAAPLDTVCLVSTAAKLPPDSFDVKSFHPVCTEPPAQADQVGLAFVPLLNLS